MTNANRQTAMAIPRTKRTPNRRLYANLPTMNCNA